MSVGKGILLSNSNKAEVTNISQFGIWVVSKGMEFFISYKDYPVFEAAPLLYVVNVQSDFSGNLHWPDLDADVEFDALVNPDKYPLSYK